MSDEEVIIKLEDLPEEFKAKIARDIMITDHNNLRDQGVDVYPMSMEIIEVTDE